MSWYDFRGDYTYCDRCGCLLEDYIITHNHKFCSSDCMENYLKSHIIRYPYGVLYDDTMYDTFDDLYNLWDSKIKVVD